MDMSRESGRRSDAHMVRYHLAVGYVRDGDTVLDAACGLGYGSHLLACQSAAKRVMGADLDREAVQYANENFTESDDRLSFRVADVHNLEFLQDDSVDLFVCFETLEHVREPQQLIAEAKRVLRPGGRLIVGVPNEWVNEEGVDPNPHHLHVYDWQRLEKEIKSHFLLKAAFAQTAGGGMKFTNSHRTLFGFSPQGVLPEAAEWWLAVAMKDPIDAKNVAYRETALSWTGNPPNVAAFSRDYENPWLVRSLVSIGWRNRNSRQRAELANRTLTCSSKKSPDSGAALCVLAYGLLESDDEMTSAFMNALIVEIDSYITLSGVEPQCRRWQISLMYVKGLLCQSMGDLEGALGSFRMCADADALVYSPLLATKTVDACRLAGVISFQAGNRSDAEYYWQLGILQAEKALKGDWWEIVGDRSPPFTFGLRESAQILDAASRCADGLHHLASRNAGCGLSEAGSVAVSLNEGDRLLKNTIRELAALQATPYLRLQRAVEKDPRSVRRILRVFYLLAIILTPEKMKRAFRPLLFSLRGLLRCRP